MRKWKTLLKPGDKIHWVKTSDVYTFNKSLDDKIQMVEIDKYPRCGNVVIHDSKIDWEKTGSELINRIRLENHDESWSIFNASNELPDMFAKLNYDGVEADKILEDYMTESKYEIDFRNTKIRTHSVEHSEYVQRKMFDNGCEWWGNGGDTSKIVDSNSSINFLFVDSFLKMSTGLGDSYEYFKNHKGKEIILMETVELSNKVAVKDKDFDKLDGKEFKTSSGIPVMITCGKHTYGTDMKRKMHLYAKFDGKTYWHFLTIPTEDAERAKSLMSKVGLELILKESRKDINTFEEFNLWIHNADVTWGGMDTFERGLGYLSLSEVEEEFKVNINFIRDLVK